MPAPTILLADDSADDVLLLRQCFRKTGSANSLHSVSDGEEALAYLRGEGPYADRVRSPFPDLLLLDLNMPRMNGFEVLSAIRQDPALQLLPVYVLTASNLPEDIRRVHALHAHGYILKPNRVDELLAFVTALQAWQRFTLWPRLPRPPLT